MTEYDSLFEFNPVGMSAFQNAMEGRLDESVLSPTDATYATRITGTTPFKTSEWKTSKEMAQAIIDACGTVSVTDLLGRSGLWAWLAFVMRDEIYPRRADGKRKLGEVHRWMPADLNDFQKGQRHLVRMPVILLLSFGDDADHALCGVPSIPGEMREQMTSQQEMFHPTIQAAARKLYFDDVTGKLRLGAASKGGGAARRFTQVRKQLDVTWDLFAISAEQFIEKLPNEFDRFRRSGLTSTVRGSETSATVVAAAP
jgi:hypothetical protein